MPSHIVDVHAHIGISSTLEVSGTADSVLRKMDENDIDMSIISPIPGYVDPDGLEDTRQQNDNIANAVRQFPDRYPQGLGTVEPRHGDRCLDEVDRIREGLGLRGLMFHCDFQGLAIDHPTMFKILERAAGHEDMVVLMHTAQHSVLEAPFMLAKVAEAFPSITFINGHPALSITHLDSSMYVSNGHANVHMDTTIWHTHLYPVEKAVKGVGAHRLFFGTDMPYFDKTMDRVLVEKADIPYEAKEAIFWRNANELFGLGLEP